jgi:hypothetical protein
MECVRTYIDDPSIHQLAERTLVGDGFTQLKVFRDGVVHARLWDMQIALATVPNKGDEDSVLLTSDAVEGLYRRLTLIRDELVELVEIISSARTLHGLAPTELAQHKAQIEQSIRAASAQLARLQKQRKSLPPLPAFPTELPQYGLTPHKPGEHLE